MTSFRVIDGCPVPASIAPYVYLVLRGAGHTAQSIYRGNDARALLHRHGKRTQAEIHRDMPAISNPAGYSQHELRSDAGRPLQEWQTGVDSGTNSSQDKRAINASAARLGWKTHHPYSRGVEGHHWQFESRPRPKGIKQRAQIIRLRATLPRK
jgi:hypothetical protein